MIIFFFIQCSILTLIFQTQNRKTGTIKELKGRGLHGKMAEVGSKSVLFVCLGNICRSPIAEAVFRKLVTDENVSANWAIDSSAVSDWNVGRPPDPRAVSCLRNHGISTAHKARQVEKILFNFY